MTVYATVEQLKAQPGVTGTDEDVTIELLLGAASAAIDGFCNRATDGFLAVASPEERTFTGSGLWYQWIDECVEIASVSVRESARDTWATIDIEDVLGFQGDPAEPNYNRRPYHAISILSTASRRYFPNGKTRTNVGWMTGTTSESTEAMEPTVTVSARWGYATAVPTPVVSATIAQASRWLKRGQSFWADTAGGEYGGELSYRQALDPDIKMMLELSRLVRPTYAG